MPLKQSNKIKLKHTKKVIKTYIQIYIVKSTQIGTDPKIK